jgi:hypothetical protein
LPGLEGPKVRVLSKFIVLQTPDFTRILIDWNMVLKVYIFREKLDCLDFQEDLVKTVSFSVNCKGE